MRITVDIEAKEIAELRAMAMPDERLTESRLADAKKQFVDEIVGTIVSAVQAATTYRTEPWQERETETPCPVRC